MAQHILLVKSAATFTRLSTAPVSCSTPRQAILFRRTGCEPTDRASSSQIQTAIRSHRQARGGSTRWAGISQGLQAQTETLPVVGSQQLTSATALVNCQLIRQPLGPSRGPTAESVRTSFAL